MIAKVLGVAEVTPYSVAYSIFTLTNVLTTAAFPYLWAAYAEALARRDVAWVLRSLRFSAVAGAASAARPACRCVSSGEWIVRVWAGRPPRRRARLSTGWRPGRWSWRSRTAPCAP